MFLLVCMKLVYICFIGIVCHPLRFWDSDAIRLFVVPEARHATIVTVSLQYTKCDFISVSVDCVAWASLWFRPTICGLVRWRSVIAAGETWVSCCP